MSAPHAEHGTLQAYVTGFILSLIFTFIPYYLVTEKIVTGTPLLVTILGFGVLQMIVQLTFFLHLGRGPSPNYNLYFLISTVGVILIVVAGSIVIINNLHYNMVPDEQVKRLVNDEGIYQVDGKKTGACEGVHANHQIIIQESKLTQSRVDAKTCDTLTFTNQSNGQLDLIFGIRPTASSYAGVSDYSVGKGQSRTFSLSEKGNYAFYDRTRPTITGTFSVND